jgi:hypothetical protein
MVVKHGLLEEQMKDDRKKQSCGFYGVKVGQTSTGDGETLPGTFAEVANRGSIQVNIVLSTDGKT